MGYLERRKALVEARDAANNGDEYVRAATRLMDFDAACQLRVEALVEAVEIQNCHSVVSTRKAALSARHRVRSDLEALDARADEVAGGGE